MAAGSSAPELFASVIGTLTQHVLADVPRWLVPPTTLPPCVQVSSSPMVMWGWEPSLAQQSSTSCASLVCVGFSLDRCV